MYGQLEQLEYINHLGETLHFGRDGLYVNENDLHDFSWSVMSVNNRISGFERGMQSKSVPVRIACASKSEGISKRNALFEIPEKDILANTYGRLMINGYYCDCFISASKKDRYSQSDRYMEATLTVTTDRPFWIKETKVEVTADTSWIPEGAGGFDFPFDFPFDFRTAQARSTPVTNDIFYDSAFRMVIHGAAVNPTVTINDHEYQVNMLVSAGRKLVIDSIAKTIQTMTEEGTGIENAFDARGRNDYIFQPIPSGELTVKWDNSFDFDLYLLEERSEPKWMIGGAND